jgi:uncharacterized protein
VIVLDTTVLVYALGADHPLRAPASGVLRAAASGGVRATTTVDVIQEFMHVRARRYGRADARLRAAQYAVGLAPLATSEPSDLDLAFELFDRHERLSAFDALLAASVVRVRPDAFVSADTAFAHVQELPFVRLGSPELEALV